MTLAVSSVDALSTTISSQSVAGRSDTRPASAPERSSARLRVERITDALAGTADLRPDRAAEPGGVPQPRNASHAAPLAAIEPLGRVPDVAERPVAGDGRKRVAPGTVPAAEPVVRLVHRVPVQEESPEERAELALAEVLHERFLAVAEFVAGGPRPQAEVDVLPDVAPGGVEAADCLESLGVNEKVRGGRPA